MRSPYRRKYGWLMNTAGENSRTVKLSWSKVRQIRVWIREGWSQRQIARALGITQGQVGRIALGYAWRE